MRGLGKKLLRKQTGFTLIELLVVVAILGMLAAIVLPNVTSFVGSGQTQAAASEQQIIQSAMDAMMVSKGLTKVTAVVSYTRDMSAFPDATNALYNPTPSDPNPSFLRLQTTKCRYICDQYGKVTQEVACP